MNSKVVSFLKGYSFQPNDINRLIVSSYLKSKNITPKSSFLKGLHIKPKDIDYTVFAEFSELISLKNLESVIEAFEFVISPEEKVVTGAVYTPLFIRQYITNTTLGNAGNLQNVLLADIACGCSGFLLTAAEYIHKSTGKSYADIICDNLYGLDIAPYSVERSKIVLSLLALQNGEDADISFNLYLGNALDFEWNIKEVRKNGGFDVILGNPPYVTSRNIDKKTRLLLHNWEVAKTGHPDLYISFFEIGVNKLKVGGLLSYITVNTFFKSINGRALREYFSNNHFDLTIIDFRGEQVFKGKSTYTCICTIQKTKVDGIKFLQTISSKLNNLTSDTFSLIKYSELDNYNGWNLTHKDNDAIIRKIEGFPNKLLSKFSFSTGIATLKNSVYKFKDLKKGGGGTYTLMSDGKLFEVEKSICRDIINSNKVTTVSELNRIKEKIIFPYSWNKQLKRYDIIPKHIFKQSYPLAYKYLLSKKPLLQTRDKGEGEYEEWYAYGRRQGLNIEGIKLFLPHITKKPNFVLSDNRKLLFCNGEAIVSDNLKELLVVKKILESEIFWYYIVATSKPYSSNFYSLGKNYLKAFSTPDLTDAEKNYILKETNSDSILKLLLKKYNLTLSDIAHNRVI